MSVGSSGHHRHGHPPSSVTSQGPPTASPRSRDGHLEVDRHAPLTLGLVSMPFASYRRPSLQVGLLAAICRRAGFPTSTHHLGVDFAARVGPALYEVISEAREEGIGDWLFSVAAFGDEAPDPSGAFAAKPSPTVTSALDRRGLTPQDLLRVREQVVPAWLDECVDRGSWSELDAVGLSCSFEQTVASIALARRLKARWPGLITVFGGANFDPPMGPELVRAVASIDLAVCGEADEALPALLHALESGARPETVPGVVTRAAGEVVLAPHSPPYAALDDAPVPDYDEYFERVEEVGLLNPGGRREVDLPYESSRGCWWGERMHCTFCGLNGTTMRFRSKSPQKVLADLAEMTARYRSFQFGAVDNILDKRYLDEVFPVIEKAGWSYSFFYEVKADLRPEQLHALRRAGVREIQPGIESLSTSVLRLMRKGTRAAQNVNLLRSARAAGVDVSWNMLWGFPGEEAAEYERQAQLIPRLHHLQPPETFGRIWLERYSPLFQNGTAIASRSPRPGYRFSYPSGVDLDAIAYFFDYQLVDHQPDETYAELVAALLEWQRCWTEDSPYLHTWASERMVQVEDERCPGRTGTYVLYPPLSDVYLATTDVPISAARVSRKLDDCLSPERTEAALRELVEAGIVMDDGPLFVALATPAGS
jgi:ribosomal peptide maturation radical SAM protein 1